MYIKHTARISNTKTDSLNSYQVTLRPGYADTDQMGVVHHSNYARFYETARWEVFRQLGMPYSTIEDQGYQLPVIAMNFQFHKPAFYDDELTIAVHIKNVHGVKLSFSYQITNTLGERINTAHVELACVHQKNKKACRIPEWILKKIAG